MDRAAPAARSSSGRPPSSRPARRSPSPTSPRAAPRSRWSRSGSADGSTAPTWSGRWSSAVTKIARDHMKYLGDTLEQIAARRRASPSPACRSSIGERDPALVEVLRREARRAVARVDAGRPGRRPGAAAGRTSGPGRSASPGPHQRRNAAVAHGILMALPAPYRPDRRGDRRAASPRPAFPGRLDRRGKWLFDVAHNPDGIRALIRGHRRRCDLPRPLHALVSILGDKEWPEMLVAARPGDRPGRAHRRAHRRQPRLGRRLAPPLARATAAARRRAPSWTLVPDFREALDDGAAGRRHRAGDRLVPHRRRRDGRRSGSASERGASASFLDPAMILPMQTKALPGFRDFYPADLALRAHIFGTWRAVATRYGFEEYDGPPLEPLELYTAKSGDEIVGQLYNFTDKGGREVALRPEMTPTLARMVAARANGLKKPIRWFSIPQLFRYERQQRGRLREHFQLNCDLIGEPGPLGDAEIIALARRRDAGLRARPGRRAGPALRPAACSRALLLGAGVAERAARRRVSGARQARAGSTEAAVGRAARRGAASPDRADRPACSSVAALRGWPTSRRRSPRAGGAEAGGAAPARWSTRSTRWGSASSSTSTSRSCAGSPTTPARCSSCSTPAASLRAICGGGRYDDLLARARRRRPARARLRHGRRGAGRAAPGPRAGAGGRRRASTSSSRRSPRTTCRPCSRWPTSSATRASGSEYALGAQAVGKQLKLADARKRPVRRRDRPRRPGPRRGDGQGSGGARPRRRCARDRVVERLARDA